MYNVTSQYRQAIKNEVQVTKVRGIIGTIPFNMDNIMRDSFSISNQCTDTNDVVLGSCYIGQLNATFTGIEIPRTEWMNKTIVPYFQMWYDSQNFDEIPLGVYTIKEVSHTAEGVEVTAYDNMCKFDKKFKKTGLNMVAHPYDFLTVLCQKCGVSLGMTQNEVEALPNGTANLYLCGVRKSTTTYANDIETYRDALFWLAQCMACFATMDRSGALVLRAYKDSFDDYINDTQRLSGAKFADYITSYTGIYTESLYDGETTYYGYDLATLQQMRDTAMQELEQIITDLADLEEEYAQGQITEEEYKAEKKRLTSEKKAKEKYISWLDKMIAQAQAEGDGAYMDLGANPFFQRRDANIPSIADATLATTLRAHILSALGKIEYTPFTCSSVFGVHYDLGDVIEFNGGHADDDHGCIMSYEWTLHGQYNMEGYGIDPDKQNVKDVKKKQSERAQKNALNATRNTTGTDLPVSPNDGDIHVVVNKITDEPLQMQYAHTVTSSGHPCDINNFSGNYKDGYSFSITGVPDGSDHGEHAYFDLQGLTDGVQYKVEFDGQFTQAQGGWMSDTRLSDYVTACGATIILVSDMNEHHYSGDFTYTENGTFDFRFYKVNDNYNYTYAVSNMKFTPVNGAIQGMEASVGGEWQNIDYVKNISQVQTSTGGTKIATANNSDGTTTDIYAPSVSANPSGASTNLTSLGIAGTDYVIKDDNAIPSTEKGANGGVAELDNSGKVPASQLPSYVDDVVEYASRSAFPSTGESGKIYIALDTNLTYRWSGSEYVEISPSLALGETSSTAYRGDRGKTAYDHATESGKISAAVASGLYKIAATAQGHIAGLTAVEKADITALGIPESMPTVNNSTITIKKNGTTVDSFTLNQSSAKNIDISVPTKTSDLTNDSGFITSYTDEKVTCESVNPTTETTYDLILIPHSTSGTNQKPKINTSFVIYLKKGTTSAVGYNYLQLGNATTSGTDGNQYGCLRLYSEKNGSVNLLPTAATTTSRSIRLPDASGTLAMTTDSMTPKSHTHGNIQNGGTLQTSDVAIASGDKLVICDSSDSNKIARSSLAFTSNTSKFLREDGTWQTVTATWSGGTVTSDILPSGTVKIGAPNKVFSQVYAKIINATQTVFVGSENYMRGYIGFRQSNSAYSHYLYANSTALTSDQLYYMPSTGGTLLCDGNATTLVSSQTLNVTMNNTSQQIYLYKFMNGVKCIHFQSGSIPAAGWTSSTGLIPAAYRPAMPHPSGSACFFSGLNEQFASTGTTVSKTRFCGINTDGTIFLYTSGYKGFWATYFYV